MTNLENGKKYMCWSTKGSTVTSRYKYQNIPLQ